VLTVLGVLFVLLVGVIAVVAYAVIEFGNIDRYKDLDVDAAPAGDPENYLVVGSDTREGASPEEAAEITGRRSDTIMIVRIDPGEEAATVLSLPRDLVVPIAGTGEEARINTAYNTGTADEGRQRLIDTIRENFGIDVNHYVEIDFQGFAKMVDAVGGVPLFFEAAVRDKESGLYQPNLGCVTLPGDQALTLVRARHLQYMTPSGEWESDPTGDLGRITRQQVFMREALSRVMDKASNPLRVRELVHIGTDTVGVDGEMSVGDILDLADRFRDFDPADLQTYSLPILDNGDGATVSVDPQAAEPILDLFRSPQDAEATAELPEVAPDTVHVTVLNGSGVAGQASEVAGALDVAGFDVVGTGNAPQVPWAQTTVRYPEGDEAAAQRLARQVDGGAVFEESTDLEAGSVELITGSDFTSITEEPAPAGAVAAPGGGDTADAADAAASDDGTEAASAESAESEGESASAESSGTTAAPAEPAAPAPPPTVGYSVGAPPPGVECD
jgi:polyisoprenyl-teichoic acid--peptidoglycan teichoic acid transferase